MQHMTLCFCITSGGVWLAEKKTGIGRNRLNGYGGKKKEGETSRSCARRELKEESGASVKEEDLIYSAQLRFYIEDAPTFLCDVFLTYEWTGALEETKEMKRASLYPFEGVPYEKLLPGDEHWMRLIFAGRKIRAEINHSKDFMQLLSFSFVDVSTIVTLF